jgi:hypothetical protein
VAQDLVRPPQFHVLALKFREALPGIRRYARPHPAIDFGAADPEAQRFARTPELLGDRPNRRRFRPVGLFMLLDESDRPLPKLRRVSLPSICHDSNLSRVGASDNPGAIHVVASPE